MKKVNVVFNKTGVKIIKGDYIALDGEISLLNPVIPRKVPPHYWKYEDGEIVVMNDEEKTIADSYHSNNIYVPNYVVNFEDLTGKMNVITADKKPEPVVLSEPQIIKEIHHEIDPIALKELESNLVYVKDEYDKSFEEMDQRLLQLSEEADEKLADYKKEIDLAMSDYVILHSKDHIEQEDILKLQIANELSQLESKVEEKLVGLARKGEADVKHALSKLPEPKIHKITIINNFKMKEYAQIASVSILIFFLLKLFIH